MFQFIIYSWNHKTLNELQVLSSSSCLLVCFVKRFMFSCLPGTQTGKRRSRFRAHPPWFSKKPRACIARLSCTRTGARQTRFRARPPRFSKKPRARMAIRTGARRTRFIVSDRARPPRFSDLNFSFSCTTLASQSIHLRECRGSLQEVPRLLREDHSETQGHRWPGTSRLPKQTECHQ